MSDIPGDATYAGVPAFERPRALRLRPWLLGEAATFAVAASIHRGLLIGGYAHRDASIAEGVLAAVLAAAFVASWIAPRRTRVTAIVAQAFAALGTCVGITTIIVGIGPRTVPDVLYHAIILTTLMAGVVVALRDGRAESGAR